MKFPGMTRCTSWLMVCGVALHEPAAAPKTVGERLPTCFCSGGWFSFGGGSFSFGGADADGARGAAGAAAATPSSLLAERRFFCRAQMTRAYSTHFHESCGAQLKATGLTHGVQQQQAAYGWQHCCKRTWARLDGSRGESSCRCLPVSRLEAFLGCGLAP